MKPEVKHINKYVKPTVELVLSLLAEAYEDELKLDKVLIGFIKKLNNITL